MKSRPPPPESRPLHNLRVLLVEDDGLVGEALRSLLESWGCECMLAKSFIGATKELDSLDMAFDLLVCDYDLGSEETGYDFIHYANKYYGIEIAAVLISGREKAELLEDFSVPLIPKPFDNDILLGVLLRELAKADENYKRTLG